MPELLMQHDEGSILLGKNTLLVVIDDTGHEEFLRTGSGYVFNKQAFETVVC